MTVFSVGFMFATICTERIPVKGIRRCAVADEVSEVGRAVGEAIRRARQARKWNQTKLGAESGLGQSSVSRIELGHQECSVGQLVALARALGVPAAELLGESTQPVAEGPPSAATAKRLIEAGLQMLKKSLGE
jgi:transcriptional regulator with XRE-family HTH domain